MFISCRAAKVFGMRRTIEIGGYVHFLSTSARNEPKKRRSGEGTLKNRRGDYKNGQVNVSELARVFSMSRTAGYKYIEV